MATKATDETRAVPQLPERYANARLVARGGMGEVWRARDTALGRDVACKLLVPGAGPEPEATRHRRFLREARAIAQLSAHPHVVTIHDIGELDGRPWLVMEWLPGGTLADRISAGRVPRGDALRWLEQLADALDAAHAAGIVHRDVKPGNVLFDDAGTLRIGDFGIARWSAEAAAMLTQPGAVIGTAAYMSPEQARGDVVGPEADQYALMVIAWQLLVGARPFERDSSVAELAAHASEPVPSAAERTGLSAAVDAVFERALAKEPASRFPSCRAAVDALAHAVARARPVASVAHGSDRVLRSRRRPSRMVGVAGALAVLVLLAVLLPALGSNDAAEDPAATTTTNAETRPPDTRPTERSNADGGDTAATQTSPAEASTPATERAGAIDRHEEAFRLLQAGEYAQALPLALDALEDLRGTSPWEAYASYNVGASLVGLERCEEALPYLERSEQLQGRRDEIDAAKRTCREMGRGPGAGEGKDAGKGEREGRGSERGEAD